MKFEQVRNWLDTNGKDRHWLAKQLGTSKSTVDGWFAGRPIAGPAEILLKHLMAKPLPLNPEFTLEEYERLTAEAQKLNISVHEFVIRAAKKEAGIPVE